MRRLALLLTLLVIAPFASADAIPHGESFLLHEQFGGRWSDVEKSPVNPDDDYLCWAAAAANVLQWTGWGIVPGISSADQIFTHYQNHWTNAAGSVEAALRWWFTGQNMFQGNQNFSQIDVPGGGGYYSGTMFSSVYRSSSQRSQAMANIDNYMKDQYAIALSLASDAGGHAVTCWGFAYDPADITKYLGVWLTDSDDDKSLLSPPDRLVYYDVQYDALYARWHLVDYFGTNNWFIAKVDGIVPEPLSVTLLAAGMLSLLRRRR